MAALDRREFLGVAAGLCLPSLPIATAGTEVFFSDDDLDSVDPTAADRLVVLWHSDREASLVPAAVFPRLRAHRLRMGRILEPEEVRFVAACGHVSR